MVSVIIPTYNRAQIISETIKSILNQTYSDLELLVVCDGRDNSTREVVEGFKDRRLKYYEIEHSGRPAVPRNFGINKASGQYIAFCDDDDVWISEKLELQIARMQDKDLGLVYAKCLLVGKKRNIVSPLRLKEGFIFKDLFLSHNFIPSSSVLIRRQVLERVGGFDEDMRLKAAEDFDLWLRITKNFKVGYVDRPLFIHRDSSDSISKGVLKIFMLNCFFTYKFYKKGYVKLELIIIRLLLIFFSAMLRAVYYDRVLNLLGKEKR